MARTRIPEGKTSLLRAHAMKFWHHRLCAYAPEMVMCIGGVVGVSLAYAGRAYSLLFWGDEIITAEVAQKDFIELIMDRYYAAHSPLYFLILKTWIFLTEGVKDSLPSEFLLRVPSLISMGLAGGFLGAAAWRGWGLRAGLLLLAMWVINPFVGNYAIEARPYALLVLLLAITIWSATRLWSAKSQTPSHNLILVSIAAPVLAAATIPVGGLAVLAMEACGWFGMGEYRTFTRIWRRRSSLVVASTVIILAIFLPAVVHRAEDYWAESKSPLSLPTLWNITSFVFLNGWHHAGSAWVFVLIASIILVLLATHTLFYGWRALPVRLAAGLALVLPLLLITLSTITSVMIRRYFIPVIPGLLLLVAASAGEGVRHHKRTTVIMLMIITLTLALHSPRLPRSFTPELELALLEKLEPNRIRGGSGSWGVVGSLKHYIPLRIGIPVQIDKIYAPLSVAELPDDEPYWLFDDPAMAGSAPVLCSYRLKGGSVLVLGRSRAALPESMRDCAQFLNTDPTL